MTLQVGWAEVDRRSSLTVIFLIYIFHITNKIFFVMYWQVRLLDLSGKGHIEIYYIYFFIMGFRTFFTRSSPIFSEICSTLEPCSSLSCRPNVLIKSYMFLPSWVILRVRIRIIIDLFPLIEERVKVLYMFFMMSDWNGYIPQQSQNWKILWRWWEWKA